MNRLGKSVWLYRLGVVSLERAAELAGLPVGDMIETLASFGVRSNLEVADYRAGLENLRKVW